MTTPQEPRPRHESDETVVGTDETIVGGPQLPPTPAPSAGAWGAPPPQMPDAAAPPRASAEAGSDATLVGIQEPHGTWLKATDRAARSANPPAHPAPAGQEPGWPGTTPSGTTERGPRPHKARRHIIIWLIVVLVVAALVAAALITRSVLAKGKYGPQKQVEAYLQAVVDGKASRATKLLDPNVTNNLRPLLTDEVYRAAKNRPTGFSIVSTHVDGDKAKVRAEVVQDGKSDTLTFTLRADGKRDMFFNAWKVENGPGQKVAIGSIPAKVNVNGVQVDFTEALKDQEDQSVELPVLPGDYTFAAPKGSKYVSYGDDLAVSSRFGENANDDSDGDAQDPVSFTSSYTPKVYEDVQAQLSERIKPCVTNTDMFVAKCLAASWEDTNYDATRKITRAWVSGEPSVQLHSVNAETGEENSASSSNEVNELNGQLSASLDDASLRVSGEVRQEDDDEGEWFGPYTSFINPFRIGGDTMSFPVSIDGDKLNVGGLDQLDRYDPENINPENREKYKQYKPVGQ